MHSQTQSQMQSFNIKQLTKQLNQARASAILINYPAVTATTATIPSSYFVPTVSTGCSVSTVLSCCAGSIPLRDLLDSYSDQLLLTDCHRPSAATEISTTKSSAARCPTAY